MVFGSVVIARQSHLLRDLPKVLIDKTQVCGLARVTRNLFVPSIRAAS